MSNVIVTVATKDPGLQGTTLFVEEPPAHPGKVGHRMDTGGCITPSAVYVPASHNNKADSLNVIVWFHGHHVADYRTHIFEKDLDGGRTMLRQSLDAADKDVVLVVPFIGHRESGDGKHFVLPNFDGKGVDAYLAKLLEELKDHLGPTDIGRLVVAWHSGSGDVAMKVTNNLGKYADVLKECWGYDCMYNNYTSWMDKHTKQWLYFYQGNGSSVPTFKAHWMYAYGSPLSPKKPRLNHVFLAPGLKHSPVDLECLTDAEVFQSYEAIKLKSDNGQKLTVYETFRLKELDPLLNRDTGEWASKVKDSVKGHYEVVQDMVTARVLGLFSGPVTTNNLIAQMQAQCKAGVRQAPPPPPKPATVNRR
jgi:hypothetical protein